MNVQASSSELVKTLSLLDLPAELLVHVFSFLDVHSLLCVSEVCKWLRVVSEESEVWRTLLERRWPNIDWLRRLQHLKESMTTPSNHNTNNSSSTTTSPQTDSQRTSSSSSSTRVQRTLRNSLPSLVRHYTPWKILYIQQLHLSIPLDPLVERYARLLRLYHLRHGTAQYTPARVAVLGDRGVGKTSLILGFVHDTFVDPTETATTLYKSYLPPLHQTTRIYQTTVNAFPSVIGLSSRAITLHFLEPPPARYITSTSPSNSSSSSLSPLHDNKESPPSSSLTLSSPTVVSVDPETKWPILCALKDVDLVLLTFNVADVESFHNVRRFYLPFVRAHCADVPVLVCALQTDRRRLPQSGPTVSEREGRTVLSLGAHKYLEFAVIDSRDPDLIGIIFHTLLYGSYRSRSCSLQ